MSPSDPEPGDAAPWARGGSMSTAWSPEQHGAGDPNGDQAQSAKRDGDERRPRRYLPMVVAVGLFAALAVIVVSQRDGGESRAGDTAPVSGPESAPESDPVSGAADIVDMAVPPERPTGPNRTNDADLEPPDPRPGASEPQLGEATATITLIEVAPALANMAPVELVALQAEQDLIEIALPGGRVRTTDLGSVSSQTQLAVTDFGALIWPAAEAPLELIAVDGTRAALQGDPPAWVSTTPGLDRFYIWPTPGDGERQRPPRSLTASGDPGVEAGQRINDDGITTLIDPTGALLIDDGHGTMRIDATSAARLSPHQVVATGRNHVLLRECDDAQRCSLTALDSSGFRTLFPTDLPTGSTAVQIGGLSPTGDALLMVSERGVTVDIPPELRLFELLDGSLTPLYSSALFAASGAWAPDGSGVFYADQRLMFFDRTDRRATAVSADLPRLRMVASRRPAQSPICDLLSIALPTFHEMSAADDGSVGAPSDELLTRTLRLAPVPLANEARPLVSFVGEFVSDQQPATRRIANWPDDVRAGLAAFDRYAAAHCVVR